MIRKLNIFLLRYNSHDIKSIVSEGKYSGFWYSYNVVQITPGSNSITPKKTSMPISHPQFLLSLSLWQ